MSERINIPALYKLCQTYITAAMEKSANNQPIGADITEPLENAFKKILEFESAYLIQCNDRFWGNLLMELNVYISFKQRGPIDLRMKENPVGLTINPLFCKNYTFPQFTGLIISELEKLVFLHPTTYAGLNSEHDKQKHALLERASNASSASIVKRDIHLQTVDRPDNGCRLPDDVYTPTAMSAELGCHVGDGQSLEYYYKILDKFKDKLQGEGDDNDQGRNGSADNGTSNPNQNEIATPNNNNGKATHDWEGGDSDDMKDTITSLVGEAYNNLSERQKGDMPSSIASQIQKLLEPPQINWKQILRKMVGSIPVPYRKTKMRLNRRQPFRGDLSGQLPKRTVNIICCFDTSGSMSDEDLKYCMNEVLNILKIYEGYKVTILECDAEVQRVYTVKNIGDVKDKMCGRGGTSFVPAIEYINGTGEYKNSKKYPSAGKYKDALMVYFTDGYGDSSIPKPKTYRNLWVIMNDEKCLSLEEPYGDVKSIKTDPGYKHF